ncbi:TetR/AcrR family transcriptional regulator [Phenylobacterium montanum]|uniref:TetR/AcrR family transcriptional regulator n=1 Tax=Phenylobacterium montanum TaxID=2823693 RepID=A0A975G4G8_9CAUL|nr:TetR/AcrR family transcriptional regulator [Caulobacter sp. S6]QUD90357.1 TetR/AcrR family transcriptional regulator [Caulobacter sp. S6]
MLHQQSKQDQIGATALRKSGRATRQASEATVRRIVEVAALLFVEKGYGVSMDQIAASASVGKQTLYRRFGSKEALFLAVIDREVQRLAAAARFEAAKGAGPLDALKECCRFLLDFMLHPDMVRLHRIFAAEAERFPNIGAYLENCMAPFIAVLQRLMWSATAAGHLRKFGSGVLVTHLEGAIVGWPIRQAMLGLDPLAEPAARDAYFETAWDLFLGGAE